MSVPHDAQEALSSERTPTLSYALPFYNSVVDQWEDMKQDLPLLSPYVEIGIRKIEEYIDKSKLSQTYLLAVCESPLTPTATCTLMQGILVLNPCLKMQWIEENCPPGVAERTRKIALEAVSLTRDKLDLGLTLTADAFVQDG